MDKLVIADQLFIRKLNTRTVSECLRLYSPLSRAELAKRTGLYRSTISSIIGELIERGFVRETEIQSDMRIGRPGMLLEFNPQGGSAIGLDMGVDYISIILVDYTAKILWRKRQPLEEDTPQQNIVSLSQSMIAEALQISKGMGIPPMGIGVGLPGLVDTIQGKLIIAPNLHWNDLPLKKKWETEFQLPVFVENESNNGAMGEFFYGAAHGKQDFIYLGTGIGLGGGIVIDGKLFKGSKGFAGEIGHTLLYKGGEHCGCGNSGCWETYVGPRYILRKIKQMLENGQKSVITDLVNGDLDKLNMDIVIEAARRWDRIATETFNEIGVHLGRGVSNLINTFNPELIVMGGALSPTSPWLIPIIQESIQRNVLPPLLQDLSIVPSQLGQDSNVMGAVALVLDNVLRESEYSW
jgi:glucokinase-like ROK family protein